MMLKSCELLGGTFDMEIAQSKDILHNTLKCISVAEECGDLDIIEILGHYARARTSYLSTMYELKDKLNGVSVIKEVMGEE